MRSRKIFSSNAKLNAVDTVDSQQDAFNKKRTYIVKKATKLFIKKGYSQTTMRDIAKATGINLGNLYGFISSKEDILCLSFDLYYEPGIAWFASEGVLEIEDPREQLAIAVHKVLEIGYDWMQDIAMMYRETRLLPPKFLKLILTKENKLIKIFEDIIIRGVEKKIFDVQDPFFAANMIIYQFSFYPLRGWNLKRYTREEYLRLAEDTVLKAMVRKSC